MIDPEHDDDVFQNEITINDLKNDTLKSSNTISFDIDGLHGTMMKNVGTETLFFALNISNSYWEHHA